MLRRTAQLGTLLLVTIVLNACQEQATQPSHTAPRSSSKAQLELGSSAIGLGISRGQLTLPSIGEVADQQLTDALGRAINPSDYVCSAASPVTNWINAEITRSLQTEQTLFLTAYNLLADLIPTYEALYFQTSATPQYFGYNGQHTKAIGKAERDLKSFWNIESSDIQVLGMHGGVLLDTIRTAATYRLFGYSAAQAALFARTLRGVILPSQTMAGGNHPFFTFNAVAFTTTNNSLPEKIVVGDGVLAVYDVLGFEDVAPQAIFAHEFAHHVQFDKGFRITATVPEQTRFAELSADMMAAYYLTHSRGATMNQKRVEQFLEIFFQIGDCSFTSNGHHGTPNQRLAAARLGFDLADQAQKQGHIMTAEQVNAVFVAAYPFIIAPDAP
jgi:hypothetical protein